MNIKNPFIIGMIHLPVTLSYTDWSGLEKFIAKAKKDLRALETGGIDAALIENDADNPCQVKGVADVVTPMTIVAYELVKMAKVPLGVEVLLNDPKASLAIAKTCGLKFIRTDYFVDKMKRMGYGEFDIDPRGLMDYKKKIGADDIKIFADVQVKHAIMIDKKKTIASSVNQAIKEGADGVIVSGTVTGVKPVIEDIREAKIAAGDKIPVLIGSGFALKNAKRLLEFVDGAIVGSSIKTKDFVDAKKVVNLVSLIKGE